MKAFLLIDKEIYPIEYETDDDLFNMKEQLVEACKTYVENQLKFIADCIEESNRLNRAMSEVRNSYTVPHPEKLTLNYPPQPNGGNPYIIFQENKIWCDKFTDYHNSGNFKKINVQLIPEAKFWDSYKKIRNA